jgi:hypothetical protein
MKDGAEPTEVLLALVSSPLLELLARGKATVMTAEDADHQPVVLAVFANSSWDTSVGITQNELVPTLELPTVEQRESES